LNDADGQKAELWALSDEIQERRLNENLVFLKSFFADMGERIMVWCCLI
jgi:hypothetical protein